MSLSTPSLSIQTVVSLLQPAQITQAAQRTTITVPWSIAGITVLSEYKGSYTPANDIYQVFSIASPGVAVQTFILVVDQPVNINLSTIPGGANWIGGFPVKKMLLMGAPPGTSGGLSTWSSLQFDGRTSNLIPMAQGVAVNYYVALCDGTLT